MEWDTTTSALNDMVRDELVQHWINDANAEYRRHRAIAGRFAEVGNHEMALKELEIANEYKRRAADWQQRLEEGERDVE